jgi:DNA-binding IclR family transcriptional regulator
MTSGLTKAVSVLDAFSDGSPVLSAEQICARNGYATATGYRYIRDMCEAGLMVRLPQGYAPGPRIIEWDYMIRANDPMLRNSRDLVSELVANTGLELLISQLYGDRIVNVYYEHSAANEMLELGRGRVMPLFRGASSRVILAAMTQRHQRRLFEAHRDMPDVKAIGAQWKTFSAALEKVCAQGYWVSAGELQPEKTGVSAPVFVQNHILGSLTLVGSTARFAALREDYVVKCVVDAAAEVTRRISV